MKSVAEKCCILKRILGYWRAVQEGRIKDDWQKQVINTMKRRRRKTTTMVNKQHQHDLSEAECQPAHECLSGKKTNGICQMQG